eukprot:SAG11_NODE_3743_length_2254_cov_1.950812_2_plen_275_part_00
MPDFSMREAVGRVSASVSSLGDSATGLVVILAASLYATALDSGGLNWVATELVEMESVLMLLSGLVLMEFAALTPSLPPAAVVLVPLGVCGFVVALIGALKSSSYLEQKLPDLMYKMHQMQLVVTTGLGVLFIALILSARNVHTVVEENWDECATLWPMKISVCKMIGASNFTFEQHAADENLSRETLERTLEPLCYACAVATAVVGGAIAGGSNAAKYAYHQNVISRAAELSGRAAGVMPSAMRRDVSADFPARATNGSVCLCSRLELFVSRL